MRRPLSPSFCAALIAALLFTVGVSAVRAGDDAETPAARWKRVSSAFAAPTAEKGFTWELDFLVNGSPMGTATVTAAPVEVEGKAYWKCSSTASFQGMKNEESEVLDNALVGQKGQSHDVDPAGVEKKVAYERQDDGSYAVQAQKSGAEPAAFKLTGKDVTSCLASALLACRLLPAEAAEYAMNVLDSDATSADDALEVGKLAVKGVQKWTFLGKDRVAWVVEMTKDDTQLELAFEPATRDLLGIQFVGAPVALAPKGSSKKEAPASDLSKPSATAQIAAIKGAIAFASADKELLEAAFHWPTVVAAMKAQPGNEELTEENLKQGLLAQLTEQAPRSMLEPMLTGMADQLATEKLENGHTLVKFPEMFHGIKFETAEIDGVWYIVKMPDAPDGN